MGCWSWFKGVLKEVGIEVTADARAKSSKPTKMRKEDCLRSCRQLYNLNLHWFIQQIGNNLRD
jgi:hypothetical protein